MKPTPIRKRPVDIDGDDLDRWLSATSEPPLDPGQRIIDPHHHLWDRRAPNADREETPTHSRYVADDLMHDIAQSGHHVLDTVYVECLAMYRKGNHPHASVGEIEFAQGVAATAASGLYGPGQRCCGGLIGFADLTQPAVADHLEALAQAGRNFRGVRQAYGWHASSEIPANHHPTRRIEGLLGHPDFRAGFAELVERDLVFDCWGYHFQMPEVAALARAFPTARLVLDHIGGPIAQGPYAGQRETKVFDEWSRGISELAACPNVVVKLGGCGMPIYGFDYAHRDSPPPNSQRLAEDWHPYFARVIEAFGPERCMFESNFPVDKVSFSYGVMWNAFKRIAEAMDLGPEDRDRLFFKTAARTYRLDLSD